MDYDRLKSLIEDLGVHPELGPEGQGWGIEQNPHELAFFLTHIPEVKSALEIGTGHKAGLARFMYECLGWDVASVDVQNYGHRHEGVRFLIKSAGEYIATTEFFDLVIIDGAHDFESVSADYEFYKEYASKVIMFHDIEGLRACEDVQKFWRSLAYWRGNLRKGFYEVADVGPHRAGIGWQEL